MQFSEDTSSLYGCVSEAMACQGCCMDRCKLLNNSCYRVSFVRNNCTSAFELVQPSYSQHPDAVFTSSLPHTPDHVSSLWQRTVPLDSTCLAQTMKLLRRLHFRLAKARRKHSAAKSKLSKSNTLTRSARREERMTTQSVQLPQYSKQIVRVRARPTWTRCQTK